MQPRCPLTEEQVKMLYIYMQWNIMQLLKKNKIMSFAETRVDLESVILSEISQKEKPCDVTYIQNLKYGTNELIY